MQKKKRILNYDEATLQDTRFDARAWSTKGTLALATRKIVNPRVSMIAIVDNFSAIYYSFMQGNSDVQTTKMMLLRLVEILDLEDKNWRANTILLLDNASYHKGKSIIKLLNGLKVPTLFTSPYSPMLSPIELLFASIKRSDINPDNIPGTKK